MKHQRHSEFKSWLFQQKPFAYRSVNSIISRLKRIDPIVNFTEDDMDLINYKIKKYSKEYKISNNVVSQLQNAAKYYYNFLNKID